MSDEDPRYTITYLDLTGLDNALPPDRVQAVHAAVLHIEQVTALARQGVTGATMRDALLAAKAALGGTSSTSTPPRTTYTVDVDDVEMSLNHDGRSGLQAVVEEIQRVTNLARGGGDVNEINRALASAQSTSSSSGNTIRAHLFSSTSPEVGRRRRVRAPTPASCWRSGRPPARVGRPAT